MRLLTCLDVMCCLSSRHMPLILRKADIWACCLNRYSVHGYEDIFNEVSQKISFLFLFYIQYIVCYLWSTLKGVDFRFFMISVPRAPKYSIGAVLNFFENSRIYSRIIVNHYCQRHRLFYSAGFTASSACWGKVLAVGWGFTKWPSSYWAEPNNRWTIYRWCQQHRQ